MLNINIEIFNKNLQLTQEYCEQRLTDTEKNLSSMFRSINPDDNGQKMFQFYFVEIGATIPFFAFGTNWRIDPYAKPRLIHELFETQLLVKKQNISRTTNQPYHGEIFAFKIDESLIDGAASVSSFGFLDDYNCPPIDTWFYMADDGKGKVLLAWVPIQLVNYADDGISVNPENCIDWFRNWYQTEFKAIEPTIKNTKFPDKIKGLPEYIKR